MAFAVLAFGTVEVWSESILEIGAAILLVWWAVDVTVHRERQIHWPIICWPLAAFLIFVTLQLALGKTVYPFLTRVALMKIMACAVLFFLAVQAFRGREELKLWAWFLMVFGFLVAVLGIAQNYTSHDVLYWYRPLSAGGDPFGPYVNRNDFAGLMVLIAPVGICLLAFRGIRREQQMFVRILTVMPVVALILTASRGGIVSFICEIALIALIARTHKSRFQAATASGLLIIAIAVAGWLGSGKVVERFKSPNLHEISANRRVTMIEGAWHIFLRHPLIGTGLGTLVAVYPKYETLYDGRVVDHVHDDYAELLAESGICGAICGLAFVLIFFYLARLRLAEEQSSFSRGLHAAAVVGCFGLLVHGFVDFNFHIPANGLVFLLQAAIGTSPCFRRGIPSTDWKSVYMSSSIDFQEDLRR